MTELSQFDDLERLALAIANTQLQTFSLKPLKNIAKRFIQKIVEKGVLNEKDCKLCANVIEQIRSRSFIVKLSLGETNGDLFDDTKDNVSALCHILYLLSGISNHIKDKESELAMVIQMHFERCIGVHHTDLEKSLQPQIKGKCHYCGRASVGDIDGLGVFACRQCS